MSISKEIFINSTLAYCSICKKVELSRIMARDEGVFMERTCPQDGCKSTKIASDYKWYLARMGRPQKRHVSKNPKKSSLGCPLDCGICEWHSGSMKLPVFSITNDCNLDCPKCFTYNRPDKKYYKSVEETKRIIDHIIDTTGGVQLINLTGGEPTLHPQLFDIIEACKNAAIGRITMNTNGIVIGENMLFAERIKQSGIQLVLSLDTLDPERSVVIHGRDITKQKKKALQVLESLDIPTTILSVCIKGVNERDVADIAKSYIKKEFVRSITIQNMTFTGKNGSIFQPREHSTIDEVEKLLSGNGSDFSQENFFSRFLSSPCYSVAYYILCDQKVIPLTKIIDKDRLSEYSEDKYFLALENDFSRDFIDGINRLWAEGEDEQLIMNLKKMINAIYPSDTTITNEQRRVLAEKMVKMLYIHSHMDCDNFDIDRVSRCGDIVPDESGHMIPACSYNLLYRKEDQRFWT